MERRIAEVGAFLARPLHAASAAFILAFLITFLRRGSNLLRPQLWAEDGTFMVPHFLNHGWWPLRGEEGYFTVVPHLIDNLALTVAPAAFLELSTWLTWIFMAGIAAFIAIAPTMLKGRFWLALACFLVPTAPEVFGVPLYSFWWAGLLLLLLPFWQPEPKHGLLRGSVLLLAALSSPIAIVTAPAMVARAFILRHRIDVILAALACLCAAAQIHLVLADPHIRIAQEYTSESPRIIIERFFGWFAWETVRTNVREDLLISGLIAIGLAAYTAWKIPGRWVGLGLFYLLVATVATSASRTDVAELNVFTGGPRYFFYPFILLAWIFIQGLYLRSCVIGRALCAVLLAGAFVNAVASGWSQNHQDIPFARHLASCLHFNVYALPLHVDGYLASVWHHDYPRSFCERLGADAAYETAELYPFAVRPPDEAIARKDAVEVTDSPASELPALTQSGFRLIGYAGEATGEMSVNLARGARLLFVNAADSTAQSYSLKAGDVTLAGQLPLCPQRCSLDFSSDLLPAQFTVTLGDRGTAPGDWFAVGLPQSD